MRPFRYIILFAFSFLFSLNILGQQKESQDSLVRLVSADSLQLIEVSGQTCRRVVGRPARFFHNNTFLLCDTAIWNVDQQIINAYGKVKIIQDRTELSSDRLTYYLDRDLAEFRGGVVQLKDKDNNTLKTRFLDYNTKDSVAVFRNGASMRDKDGQIIESVSGNYDSKIKTFVFTEDVNMYTDSIFVKTSYLKYESEYSLATFGFATHAWRDDNMLSANAGTYDRANEKFFFHRDVHVMNETQEAWSDSLYFYRNTMDVTMLGNTQVTDTTRSVHALAGRIDYVDSLSSVTLSRLPAVVAELEDEKTGRDSVWFGADTLRYWTVPKCDVDSLENLQSAERLKSVSIDPVSELRKKSAEAAAKAAEEAAKADPNNPAAAEQKRREAEKLKSSLNTPPDKTATRKEPPKKPERKVFAKRDTTSLPPVDEVNMPENREAGDTLKNVSAGSVTEPEISEDSGAESPETESQEAEKQGSAAKQQIPESKTRNIGLGEVSGNKREILGNKREVAAPEKTTDKLQDQPSENISEHPADSLAQQPVDSLAAQKDTTKIGFVYATGKVKVFRNTMQVLCDSLRYSDLDSLARLYKEPKIWNEGNHQYISDSVYVVVRNGAMEKANLMSNAFIHIQEDTLHYDQIRSAEMVAYFDSEGQLSRFDALGGAMALFYIEENDELATVNKKDSKMLSAIFSDGNIQRIYYFEDPKSDAYPVVQMSKDDQTIKGFAWSPDLRPKSRYDITDLQLRPSERKRYSRVPHAKFHQTDIYFPGYIADVQRQIAVRDSLKAVREQQRQLAQAEIEAVQEDSVKTGFSDADTLKSLNDSTQTAAAISDKIADRDSLVAGDALVADGSKFADESPAVNDSTAISVADSLYITSEPNKKQLKQKAREEKTKARAEARKKRRDAAQARWEERETRRALVQARKDAKKSEKLRKQKVKAIIDMELQKSQEEVLLQKYLRRYEKQKAKADASASAKNQSDSEN